MYKPDDPELRFEWNPAKAVANARKHGVTFEDACEVFADERAVLREDDIHSIDEPRFVLLGLGATLRLLVVVHCYRARDHCVRIISARRATTFEASFYDR
jgi:uncharacterized DUF497 family protein